MSSVNAIQIGGDHYAAPVQHWDYCESNNIGYLESAASKYVTRWRKKNGRQDLEKAVHYIDKIRETFACGWKKPPGWVSWVIRVMEVPRWKGYTPHEGHVAPRVTFEDFARANKLGPREWTAARLICEWRTDEDLAEARRQVVEMIAILDAEKRQDD